LVTRLFATLSSFFFAECCNHECLSFGVQSTVLPREKLFSDTPMNRPDPYF